jgi:hypothetical protein
MEIVGKSPGSWRLNLSGGRLRLDFEGEDGRPVSVVLPADNLDRLPGALPDLIDHARKVRYREPG